MFSAKDDVAETVAPIRNRPAREESRGSACSGMVRVDARVSLERARRRASRKLSEERDDTLIEHSSHSSMCLQTTSALTASSCPLPKARKVCSEGCGDGDACMGLSPKSTPGHEYVVGYPKRKAATKRNMPRK